MKRFLLYLTFGVGAWVLASFGGAMLDPARAEFWTQSLMASLIASLVLAPFVFFLRRRQQPASTPRKEVDTASSETSPSPAAASFEEEEPFVSEEADRMDTLWPEAEESTEQREHA
jgi:hypothetical protein